MRKILGIILLLLAIASFGAFFLFRSNQEYTIIFDSNGGSFVNNQKVKYKEKVNKPVDPTRENYTFIEWKNNGVTYDFNSLVEDNILLTASWQENKMYVVTIDLEGIGYEAKYYEGSVVNLDNFLLPNKDGYTIALYRDDVIYDLETPITSDLKLIAKYEKNS